LLNQAFRTKAEFDRLCQEFFIEDQKKHFGITSKDYARHRARFPDFLFQQLFP